MLLALIPAILMALAVVREKELGSITNLYVTPVRRIEFLLGKQLPYVVVAMLNFAVLAAMAVFVFGVPLKGSLAALAVGALIYVTATTALRPADLELRQHADRGAVRHRDPDRAAGDAVLRHADAGLRADRVSGADGAAVPDDLFPADQRRHLHQVARLRRTRRSPSLRTRAVRPGADRSAAWCCCASRSAEPMRRALANIFWLATKEVRSFLHDFALAGARDLQLLAGDLCAGAEHLAGSCTTPRSRSSTRTARRCRATSRRRSCRPTSSRRCRSSAQRRRPAARHRAATPSSSTSRRISRATWLAGRTPAVQVERRCDGGDAGRASAPATSSRSWPAEIGTLRDALGRRSRRAGRRWPCASPTIPTC